MEHFVNPVPVLWAKGIKLFTGLACPHAALAFHGEPLEIGRHALLAIVQCPVQAVFEIALLSRRG